MSVFELLWVFFIISALVPMFRQKVIEARRVRLFQFIERNRGSRVIVLIHRQEVLSLLGLPLFRYINIEDSEEVLRAIRLTPDEMPIDVIIHTPGGLVLAAEQIAGALAKHPAKVTVIVPHYAMSGGTMIALAADEIVMDENAVLGPVDPQLGEFPAVSILSVLERKSLDEIDDKTIILADVAAKAMRQVREFLVNLMAPRFGKEKATEIATKLSEGRWTHDYPIGCEEAREFGLVVSCAVPPEIYGLMRLYPQPRTGRPSVEYVPVPYRTKEPTGK